jgi:hypothetical protein
LLNENGFPCEYGLISYTDSSDWSNVQEFLVVGDPAIYEVAKARAQKIMTAESASELDPEGIFAGGKECKFCPFTRACAELRCSRVPEKGYKDSPPLAPTQAALLESHVLSYHDACDAIAVWEKVVNDEKEAVRNILEGAGVRNYKGNGVSVSWSKVAGRKTWDNALIRERYQSDLGLSDDDMKFSFMKEGDPSDRLTISVKK